MIAPTADGSATLYSERFQQHYHSLHGAEQESRHVFLRHGLQACEAPGSPVRVFEMGFGTGLNALLTLLESPLPVHYVAVEAFPISLAQMSDLAYGTKLGSPDLFEALHTAAWNRPVQLTPTFTLEKWQLTLEEFPGTEEIDLVYWDAFDPKAQPELWTEEVFRRVAGWARGPALLTTYSAKGDVRRALLAAGWLVEKLPGPPGKREMLRGRRG